jgi:two-component sensor histidine kinase
VRLDPRLTLLISMALHELCTNAAKYGALSNNAGAVSLAWNAISNDDASKQLNLSWIETGGPEVKPPQNKGFGSRLIESAFAGEFGGSAAFDYRPDGLVCDIRVRLSAPPARSASGESGDHAAVTGANARRDPAAQVQSDAGRAEHAVSG